MLQNQLQRSTDGLIANLLPAPGEHEMLHNAVSCILIADENRSHRVSIFISPRACQPRDGNRHIRIQLLPDTGGHVLRRPLGNGTVPLQNFLGDT